ncbi:T4 RnlA family RNA ligase [Candidatus Pacearchaeota archaeon]|nr:T4 RnlA family RNA ligase [Candidatus Pacearchaeota archaeon]
MLVQEFIRENGLNPLKEQPYHLDITEYDNGLVVLNYNQINSPKNNPIIKECRGLILDSNNDWSVVARSFDRFFNYGECQYYKPEMYPMTEAIVLDKLDGTFITVYWFDDKWNVATRKMAFAEGGTKFDSTYRELFDKAFPDWESKLEGTNKSVSFVFELTSPENRIVTPYSEYKVYLLTIRDNKEEREWNFRDVKTVAKWLGVETPKTYKMNSIEEVIKSSKELPAMEEGYVCVWPDHYRLKLKNPSYMAIAHLRNNGDISLRRVARLVMAVDEEEYLTYFPEDRKIFEPYVNAYNKMMIEVENNWFCFHDEKNQKRFALSIKDVPAKHILFAMRNKGKTMEEALDDLNDEAKISLLENYKRLR